MNKLLLTPEAEKDLEKIYLYTLNSFGLLQAEKYQDDLYFSFQQILKHNYVGEQYLHSKVAYRKLHFNKHLIFYKIVDNDCIIVRILHERMNPLNYFD